MADSSLFASSTPLTPTQELERIQRERILYQRVFTFATTLVAGLSLGGAMAQLLAPSRTCAR